MGDERATPELAERLVAYTDPALLAWFEERGMCRHAVEGDAEGAIIEVVAPPVVLLGSGSGEARACANPDLLGYPTKRLAEMDLNDYHIFMLRWMMRAIDAGQGRCIVCKQQVSNDKPDEPWDGIYIEKELVCWLIIHFDCKRGLQREFKGRHAFEVTPLPPESFDVSYE